MFIIFIITNMEFFISNKAKNGQYKKETWNKHFCVAFAFVFGNAIALRGRFVMFMTFTVMKYVISFFLHTQLCNPRRTLSRRDIIVYASYMGNIICKVTKKKQLSK